MNAIELKNFASRYTAAWCSQNAATAIRVAAVLGAVISCVIP